MSISTATSGVKTCARCGQDKHWSARGLSEYTVFRRKRKRGGYSYRPQHICKACKAEQQREYRARGGEELRQHHRRWQNEYRDKNRDATRLYERVYLRRQRILAGGKPRNFSDPIRRAQAEFEEELARRSLGMHGAGSDGYMLVPARPFITWFDEWLKSRGMTLEELLHGVSKDRRAAAARSVSKWRADPDVRGSLWTMDDLAVAMGAPDQLAALYYEKLE